MADQFTSGLDAIVLITRLDACLYPLRQLGMQLEDIETEDEALKPELDAMREHLRESAAALRRAVDFIQARYDVGNEAA